MFREGHFRDAQVDQAFQQGLESYHLYLYRTSEGTQPAYLFIEIQVNGQPETLKALPSCGCDVPASRPEGSPAGARAVELQMLNESGKDEPGVFRFPAATPPSSSAQGDAGRLYIQHVIF